MAGGKPVIEFEKTILQVTGIKVSFKIVCSDTQTHNTLQFLRCLFFVVAESLKLYTIP